jgi:hypothetical protein
MSESILRPYRFAPDALSLACSLVGVEGETTASGDLLVTQPLPDEGPLRIATTIRVAPGTIERVVGDEERSHPPVEVALMVRSASSRLRERHTLVARGEGYATEFDLPLDRLHSRVSLFPVIARTSRATNSRPGFADHLGAILATGRSIDVLLEEPVAPPGGYLDIEFEVFSESQDPLRRRNATQLFAIDLEGDFPKLWLNQGIEGFEAVMRTRARRGVPRRIRDATYDTLCCQVWTALLSASLNELADTGSEDLTVTDAIGGLAEWQQRVIHFWAPRLYPELASADQALAEMCSAAWGEGHGSEIQERASVAIQAWAGSAEAFAGLVRMQTGEAV